MMKKNNPVPSELWQKDEEVSYCELCEAMFIPIFVRKHHCRRCGKIFCGYCADFTDKFVLPGESQANIHRVCKTCFMTKALDEWEIVDPSTSPSQSKSNNPFDVPKVSHNPFDQPNIVSPNSQPKKSHNPFDHPEYQAPKISPIIQQQQSPSYNPFDHPDYREKNEMPKNSNINNHSIINNSNNINNNNNPSYNPFEHDSPLLQPKPFPNLPDFIAKPSPIQLPPPRTNSNPIYSNADLPLPFPVKPNSNNNNNNNNSSSQSAVTASRLNAPFGTSNSTPFLANLNQSTTKNTNPIQYHAKSQPQIQTKTNHYQQPQQQIKPQPLPQPQTKIVQPKPVNPPTTKPIVNYSNNTKSNTSITNKSSTTLSNSNYKPKEMPNPSAEHYIASKFFLTEAMKKADNADFDCPICFETFQNGDMTARLACFCLYHQHCIETWWRRINYKNLNCPMHDLGTQI